MAVIPVYNNLVLSNTNVYLKTDTFEKAAGHVPQADERTVIIVLRNEEPLSAVTEGSFYPIGVSGFVSEIHDEGWLAVRSTKRVNIDEVSVSPGGHIEVVTSPREDTDILNSHDDHMLADKWLLKDTALTYTVDDSCIRCGICAKVCPAKNITVTAEGVRFSDHCEVCYACLHNCPQHAIHMPLEAGTAQFRNEHVTLKDIIESNQ